MQNKSRVIFLTGELQKVRKGSMKIEEYFNSVKSIADNLALAGKTVESTDLITQVFAGLDEEYTPIVVQITGRKSIT